MRFMHIGSVRLGLDPESEKRFGRQRALELKETFQKAVDQAAEEGCDLLLISGSLFCHQPVTRELAEINRIFLAVPALSVVIIAGHDDPLHKNAPVRSFRWAPNVRYAAEEGPHRFYFPEFDTSVYAVSETDAETDGLSALLAACDARFSGEERAAVRFLMLPGLSAEEAEEKEAALSGFSYVAVGGAERKELSGTHICCAGALEPVSMSETGAHGGYIGDISTASGRMIGLEFRPLAAASYVPLLMNVTEETTAEDLRTALRREMELRGKNSIYRIRISGKRAPETEFAFSELEAEYRISEILDESVPQYDFQALFAEHPQDMIGFYISRLLREKDELSGLSQKAMYYGIEALLKTARNVQPAERKPAPPEHDFGSLLRRRLREEEAEALRSENGEKESCSF